MISKPDDLPSDLVSALAALQAEREARLRAEAMAASARAELSDNEALIAQLQSLRGPHAQARDQLLAAERQLVVAQARLTELKNKYEDKEG